MRFTDLAISRLKPPITGEVVCWDTILVGLGVRASHTGRKTWIVAINGSKQKLGRYPTMDLSEARTAARVRLEVGGSPTAPVTFKQMVEQFLEHGRTKKGRPLRQNTMDQYRRVLNRYAQPLHRRKFAEIRRREVAELLRTVAAESGAPTASLVRSMLARLWSYAMETDDDIEANVVAGTPGYAIEPRSRTLTDGELAAIWAASPDLGEYGLMLRLLLWTGARRGEVGGVRWSELPDGVWTVPGSRTKNHRPLVLPLPRQAVAALASWPRVVGKDTLFGVHSARGFNNWAEAKRRLDAKLYFNRDFNVHDIRRSVQSRMAGLGVNRVVVNEILNHATDPVTATYDRYDYLPEKVEALQKWADELERIVSQLPVVTRLRGSA
jgi:integrase